MVDPPLATGAVNATVAVVCPVAVAVPIVGGSATVAGSVVIEPEGADDADTPTLLVAVTVKV